ncbi:MAG: hypothetical protein M3Z23_00520 [Acidobacteriota bacterium]|nr:hypothetical protein [Acidobacteriota bacterium]
MFLRPLSVLIAGCVLTGAGPATAARKSANAGDPTAKSVFPFTGQIGSTFLATVRGANLAKSTGVFADGAPFTATIDPDHAPDSAPPAIAPSAGMPPAPEETVRLRVQVHADAKPGRYSFRMMTPRGVSNALPLYLAEQPVFAEPEGTHETPETAVFVDKFPVVLSGKIARRGETDYYAFDAGAGQKLTFQAISGLPTAGAPGGNTGGFDPSIAVYEPSGSWFDSKRINRIAFNDEPLWVVGKATDAYLVHSFAKKGRYLLRIEAFSGQGGPDYGYQIKIAPGEIPQDEAPADTNWQERDFTRRLSANRLNELAERGGKAQDQKTIETYNAKSALKIPGTIEGGLTQPGEAQRTKFHLDGPQDIAIEIETPADTTPLFNPIVRLLDADGKEVATNIYASHDGCTNEMSKSIQAKTTIPLRDAGDYTIEIRDTTPDHAAPGFRYRVQIRPQIPHVGQVNIGDDHVNLSPGLVKTVRVMFDREEGYEGAVAVTAESLPPGVQAMSGADFEPDKDPPSFSSKRERYTPRTERVVVVFTASPDAAITTQPQIVQLVVRPIVDGKLGAIIGTKEIPVTVVAKN